MYHKGCYNKLGPKKVGELRENRTFDRDLIDWDQKKVGELRPNQTFDRELEVLRRDRNIYEEMLRDQRSANTKRAYERDLRDFFGFLDKPVNSETVLAFVSLRKPEAVAFVLKWKHHLIAKGLKPATIERKIVAVRSLVKFASDLGLCDWTLNASVLKGLSPQKYRDTAGVTPEWIQKMFNQLDLSTDKGKRDNAILQLLWANALRRSEVVDIDIADVNLSDRCIWILGKGKQEKQRIAISSKTVEALKLWLSVRIEIVTLTPALFVNLDGKHITGRLSDDYLYYFIRRLSVQVGIDKPMSPHRIRHSAITAALEATGDIRKAQDLSRHADPKTLMIYDDNKNSKQAEVSEILDGLIQ